ncbi:MAG: hypothetical protein C0506_07750 [Anaerolinea sp.]|nr:hypothetical protein [Anaerolinea sp.]
MKPWETLAEAVLPDGSKLTLRRHDGEYVIAADGYDLMVSRMHGSEEALAALALGEERKRKRVLIGGLGMGYTLRAALDLLPPEGEVVVAELLQQVVDWNRGELGALAGNPLDDPRTTLDVRDVRDVIRLSEPGRWDAILLDIDNGPDSWTQQPNAWLYTPNGLAAIERALKPKGVLGIWAVRPDPAFERRLGTAGFHAETRRVRARGKHGGPMQAVFIGRSR